MTAKVLNLVKVLFTKIKLLGFECGQDIMTE